MGGVARDCGGGKRAVTISKMDNVCVQSQGEANKRGGAKNDINQ